MRFIKINFALIIAFVSTVQSAELPQIQTKQALDNIRFISKDGKYTYYQQRSGDLHMSTNYNNSVVMKNDKGTYYTLSSSESRRKIVIEVIKNYHKSLDYFKLNEIYLLNMGKTDPKMIANGKNPQLHLKDRWLSYFVPRKKEIRLKNIMTKTPELSIKLFNPVNPYFTPQVIMPTPDTVFYTDINKQGYMAIQMYTLSEKKITTVYKAKFAGIRLDFCKLKEELFIGEFSYDGINRGSSILKLKLFNNPGFKKFSTLYQSPLPDIGHLTCSEDDLYFIKTTEYNENINSRKSEAASLALKNNKVKILTELNYVTNIVKMDGTILIPFRHKYYVAHGKSLLNQDALKNKK